MVIFGIVLTFFCYVFVAHHLDVPAKVQRDRTEQLGGGSGVSASVAERTQPVGQLNVATAAESKREPAQTAPAAAAPAALSGQKVYEGTCIACHGAGIAGAPKFGDATAWKKRLAKGVTALYTSAIKGLQGSTGVMPPKGGNAGLSDAEVKAAVDYIVAKSK
jgi:cytochrome c5